MPLERTAAEEGSAYGAALLGGVAGGLFADVHEAVAACVRVRDTIEPRPDWVRIRPRLTGICGSDAKQVFMDWGDMGADNPMREFSSMPQVPGHEVVADVVALGPEAEGLEIGDRVVLNPWLSCAPRGISPLCPACEVGDLSLCWNFTVPPLAVR